MAPPNIAIVGAGPAGCTLARLLHLAAVPVTVFESDASPNFRSQGGSLDLHTSTALAALTEAGLYDTFLRHARYDGDFTQMTDQQLNVFFTLEGSQKPGDAAAGRDQRPEIDRPVLRRMLVESLPDGTVQWGRRLRRVILADDDDAPSPSAGPGTATLEFADGSRAGGFDLVVGADGAWSRVRAALSAEQPSFVGIGCHELSVPAGAAPAVHAMVRRGNLFAYGDGRKLSVQQMGDGSLCVYTNTLQDAPDWFAPGRCAYDARDPAATARALLDGPGAPFADSHPLLREAVRAGTAACVPRSLYMLPVGFRWAHRRGATVIGDAAHLMTPFAGEGVNLAMEDAMLLARAIVSAKDAGRDALDEAVARSERELWPRTEKTTRLTDDLTRLYMFTPGSPDTVAAHAISLHAKHMTPRALQPLASAAVHSWFFFKRLSSPQKAV